MTKDENDSRVLPPPERSLSESSTLDQAWSPKQPGQDRPETFSIPINEREEKKEFEKRICLDDHNRAVHGYPKLATFMAHEPGGAIARRFASLNLRILLYKQAEIVCLEHELDELETKFRDKKDLHHSVKALIHAEAGSEGKELWDKIQSIDVALERYNRLLLEQKALYELPSADHIDINDLNNFANNEEAGGEWLAHPENTIWAIVEDNGKRLAEQKDLVRLSGSERYTDPFTQWLWGPFLQFFHRIYSKFSDADGADGSYDYNSAAGILVLARATSMALASLLPTVSILALYHINNDLWRIGFIAIFSVVFTACLSFFTAATRIEIFIASIGLASVQVVFIGNLLTSSSAPTTSTKSK
ncbi:ATP synthase subunit gamma [Venturia nashicola]|nr:ATP synthase subunit gamma [Venturia nashicola]